VRIAYLLLLSVSAFAATIMQSVTSDPLDLSATVEIGPYGPYLLDAWSFPTGHDGYKRSFRIVQNTPPRAVLTLDLFMLGAPDDSSGSGPYGATTR